MFQLKGPETVNQPKISNAGPINIKKMKPNIHWVHSRNVFNLSSQSFQFILASL